MKVLDPVLIPKRLFRNNGSWDGCIDDLKRQFRAILLRSLLKNGLKLKRIGFDIVRSGAKGGTGAEDGNSNDLWTGLNCISLLATESL